MALTDILAAITAQADMLITEARNAHQKELTSLREAGERAVAKKKQEIAVQREQRKEQLKTKAENHAVMLKRNTVLEKKRELLDRTYASVVKELGSLPDAKVETLFKHCLASLNTKGTIHPAKKHVDLLKKLAGGDLTVGEPIDATGGFVFVSSKQEADFTFERIVSDILRPRTELETSQKLFA